MPKFIDPIYYKSGSTEVQILSTAGVISNVSLGTSVTLTSNITGTLSGVTLSNPLITVTAATTASDTIPGYGLVTFSPSTAAQAYTLPKPVTGAEVTYCNLTGTSNDTITLTGTTNTVMNKYKTIVIPGPMQSITLQGASTNTWIVKSISSTAVALTTSVPSFSS